MVQRLKVRDDGQRMRRVIYIEEPNEDGTDDNDNNEEQLELRIEGKGSKPFHIEGKGSKPFHIEGNMSDKHFKAIIDKDKKVFQKSIGEDKC